MPNIGNTVIGIQTPDGFHIDLTNLFLELGSGAAKTGDPNSSSRVFCDGPDKTPQLLVVSQVAVFPSGNTREGAYPETSILCREEGGYDGGRQRFILRKTWR